MKRSALLLIITTIVFVRIGYAQNDKGVRYAQLKPIKILELASPGGSSQIIAVDAGGKLVYENVQTLTATNPNPTPGANLVLSQMVGVGGGTVRLVGTGYTTVSYTDANTVTISSTGDGVGGDSSISNEGYLSVTAGTASTSVIDSNTSGSPDITIAAGSGIGISESGNTITLTAVDASATNEAQTLTVGDDSGFPTINLSKVSGASGGTINFEATSPIKLAHSSNVITISSDAPTNVSIADDVTSTAKVYPLWTAGTGAQPLKISSTQMSFTPSTGVFAATGGTFTNNILVNEITVGTAGYSGSNNLVVGKEALSGASVGNENVAIGNYALKNNTTGSNYNVAVGYNALKNSTDGGYNTAIGKEALLSVVGGTTNTAIGNEALSNMAGYSSANTAVGSLAGTGVSGGNNCIYIGYAATGSGGNHEIVIGAGATGNGGNTISLGTSFVDRLYIANYEVFYQPISYGKAGSSGQILTSTGSNTAPVWRNFSLSGGGKISVSGSGLNWSVSSTDPDEDPTNEIEKLKIDPTTGALTLVGADGTPIPVVGADGNPVTGSDGKPLTSIIFSGLIFDSATKTFKLPCPCNGTTSGVKEAAYEVVAVKDQTKFTLDYIPDTKSFVKMYINGVRISNAAYSFTSTDKFVNYLPEKNGGHTLLDGERVQFDYSYSVQ